MTAVSGHVEWATFLYGSTSLEVFSNFRMRTNLLIAQSNALGNEQVGAEYSLQCLAYCQPHSLLVPHLAGICHLIIASWCTDQV